MDQGPSTQVESGMVTSAGMFIRFTLAVWAGAATHLPTRRSADVGFALRDPTEVHEVEQVLFVCKAEIVDGPDGHSRT